MAIFALIWAQSSVAGNQTVLREHKFNFEQIAVLAKSVERTLAAKRVHVALIGRVGLNPELLPPGVTFSHTAIAIYSKIKTADGRLVPGYAVYNLYQGAQRTGRSVLAQDYPVDYFAISQSLKSGVIIPNEKLQLALIRVVSSDTYRALHNPNYSVIANPFNALFQNCTEFVLDVLFAAVYDTSDIRAIKANITAYFDPYPILIDVTKLTFAAATMPDVTLDDHSGAVATATFSSIAKFLFGQGIAREAFILTADPSTLHVSREEFFL